MWKDAETYSVMHVHCAVVHVIVYHMLDTQ